MQHIRSVSNRLDDDTHLVCTHNDDDRAKRHTVTLLDDLDRVFDCTPGNCTYPQMQIVVLHVTKSCIGSAGLMTCSFGVAVCRRDRQLRW